jgi:hypothetical protein
MISAGRCDFGGRLQLPLNFPSFLDSPDQLFVAVWRWARRVLSLGKLADMCKAGAELAAAHPEPS